MEKSSFFNSINGDRKYKAEDFAAYFGSFISNGIFPNPADNLRVVSNDNMTVTLKPGKAWINGYFYVNDDDLILPIDVADGVLDRIDRVVIRLDYVNREIRAVVKKGTFASSPVAPELQRDMDIYELCVAEIKVSKGAVSILQSDITDTRLNLELCGVTNSLITVDVGIITEQFSKDFTEWFERVKEQLGEDPAGNLQNQIDALNQNKISKEDFDAHKADNTAQFAEMGYNIYQLYLQNYYDGKYPYKRGLFFDGFLNEDVIDKVNSNVQLFTKNKKIGVVYSQVISNEVLGNLREFGRTTAYTSRIAQSFRVEKTILVEGVKIAVRKPTSSLSDGVRCRIVNMVDGKPSGSVIATSQIIQASEFQTGVTELKQFDFNVLLEAGTYALIVERTGSLSDSYFWYIEASLSDVYSDGVFFQEINNVWTPNANWDLGFEIINNPSPRNPVYQSQEQIFSQNVDNAVLYVKAKQVTGCFISSEIAIYTDTETFSSMTLDSIRDLGDGYQEYKFVYSTSAPGNKVKVKITLNRPDTTTEYEANQYGCILGVE